MSRPKTSGGDGSLSATCFYQGRFHTLRLLDLELGFYSVPSFIFSLGKPEPKGSEDLSKATEKISSEYWQGRLSQVRGGRGREVGGSQMGPRSRAWKKPSSCKSKSLVSKHSSGRKSPGSPVCIPVRPPPGRMGRRCLL